MQLSFQRRASFGFHEICFVCLIKMASSASSAGQASQPASELTSQILPASQSVSQAASLTALNPQLDFEVQQPNEAFQ